jgi:predicted metal-binding membrane protein
VSTVHATDVTDVPGPRRTRHIPLAIPAAIAGAWALAVFAQLTGRAATLHHDALIHSHFPTWAALLLFLVAWQVMVAAMMLPSSVPMFRLFSQASASQPRRRPVMVAFFGSYVGLWSLFGAVAFLGDVRLHHAVDATPWLEARPWLIAGSVLALAGVFQFTPLKDRCLRECRHPGAFLLQHYRRGVKGALQLGVRHAAFCVGCCWALMLLRFGARVANLWWMAALTGVMVYEKVGRYGRRITPVVGFVLIELAAVVLWHPAWLPAAFSAA